MVFSMRTPEEILKLLQELHKKDMMEFALAMGDVTEEEAQVIASLSEVEKDEFRKLTGQPLKATPTQTPEQ